MIKTGNKYLDSQLAKDYSFIGIFDSIKSFPKKAKEGNRVILIGGNAFEYQSEKRVDLGVFILPQGVPGIPGRDGMDGISPNEENIANIVMSKITLPKDGLNGKDGVSPSLESVVEKLLPQIPRPKDGVDGKDGKDGVSPKLDYKKLAGEVFVLIKQDKEFLDSIHGKDGIDGVDGKDGIAPTMNEIIGSLVNNQSFIQKCSIKGDKGEDGISPDIKDILFAIKSDKEFIKLCSIKGDKGDVMKFDDLSQAQLELIKGPVGEGIPGPMGPKGFDGDRLFIQYSSDGQKNRSYKYKEGDKYMSVGVGKQEPQIMQFIFKD